MNIFIIKQERENLVNKLVECDEDDEVINLLSGIKNRGFMIEIIIGLLNELSEERQENIDLKQKLSRLKREKREIEVL